VRIVGFVVVSIVMVASLPRRVDARPPPDDHFLVEPDRVGDWHTDRATFEWSSWIRLGYGVGRETSYQVARSDSPTPVGVMKVEDQRQLIDAGLGADVTFPIPTKRVRMGPWIELRPHGTFLGAEVSVAGKPLDMFFYEGERVLAIRGGASLSDVTAAVAYGYRCPWKLWGPYNRSTRYMIGVRIVGSFTRSQSDPGDWYGSLGLEFEPVGSLRYVAGIRSWY
jgi:hypothetical protein